MDTGPLSDPLQTDSYAFGRTPGRGSLATVLTLGVNGGTSNLLSKDRQGTEIVSRVNCIRVLNSKIYGVTPPWASESVARLVSG